MRGSWLALGLAVVLSAVGCGSTKTVTKTVASPGPSSSTNSTATQSTSTTTTPASPQPCPTFRNGQIAPSGLVCTANGITLRVEHQSDVLHLKTLTARVTSVSTTSTLSGGYSSKTAQGTFIVISLDFTNEANSPETFAPGGAQTAILGAQSRQYSEDFAAENGPDPHSCVSNNDPIQPGADRTCDVVYDIPTPAVQRARAHGLGLIVGNFGDNLSPQSTSQTPSEAGIVILDPLGRA